MTTKEKIIAGLAFLGGVIIGSDLASAGSKEKQKKAYLNGVVDGIGQQSLENSDCSEKTKEKFCRDRGLDRQGCNKVAKQWKGIGQAHDTYQKALDA